jgi:hypothetical protein
MELNDEFLFFSREGAFFKVGSQVVGPPKSAALATPGQSSVLLHSIPVAFPLILYILH